MILKRKDAVDMTPQDAFYTEPVECVIVTGETKPPDHRKTVEKIMSDAIDRFFVTDNPHDHEPLDVIRLADLYAIVCSNLGVDPDSTDYSSYAN